MKSHWLILALSTLMTLATPAQDFQRLFKAASGTEPVVEKETNAEEQLPWAKDQLEAAQRAAKEFDSQTFARHLTSAGLPASRAEDLKADLDSTVRSYGAGLDALAAVIENRSALEAARKDAPPATPMDDKGIDELNEKSASFRRDIAALETQITLDDSYLERQKVLHAEASRELRRLNEELTDAPAPAKSRVALLVRLAEARALAASSSVFAVSWRLYADQLEKQRLELTTQQIHAAKSASGLDTIFVKSRAQAGLDSAAQDIQSIEASLNKARQSSSKLTEELSSLREQKPPDENALKLMMDASSIAEKTLRGYELWLAGAQLKEKSWRLAAAVAENPDNQDLLVEARDLADQTISNLNPWKDFLRKNISDANRNEEVLRNSPTPPDSSGKKLLARVMALNTARLDQLRSLEIDMEELLSMAERLMDESRERLVSQSLKAKATHAASKFQESAKKLWDTEVFATDQTFFAADGTPGVRKRGVTLGRLGLAVLAVLLAVFFAKRFARLLTRNLRARFSMDKTRIEFLERAVFFTLAGLIVLTALNWLHIPLTAFAFMGGALAIGIGFGVQTLMNNFISGMILTAERRVKVGDVVEVDGHLGTVLSLGTRSCTIRKFNGIEVLVPNSYLLEKNVENWTMSDPHHRFDFVVGVDYGADTDLVKAILIDAVKNQQGISPSPAPSVFFEQFGDNSLNFRVYFWINIREQNSLDIGSEIRLRINRRLCEEGIGIAYPQRDIHLHAAKPIQVELRPSADSQAKPGRD